MTVIDPATTAAPRAPADSSRRRTPSARTWLPPIAFGVGLVLLWQLLCRVGGIPTFLLPAPSAILAAAGDNVSVMVDSTLVTGRNALIGLLVGILTGLAAAMLAVWIRPFDELLGPLATAAAAIPIVATAPVFYGMYSATQEMPRILTVALIVFFPIYVSAARGLRDISAVHADLMRSYAIGKWAETRTVRIPAALGFVFTGLRIAAPNAVIAEIVAEYFGGLQNGLGYRITSAAAATDYASAWSYVVASIVLGLVFFVAVVVLETVVAPHRPSR
ncbi:ABC transporter permease [Williamsia sterculiae]|uniref:NitT/TauT family transport system permease protein n=1 Tax=Williamsia sterculiae TaxID=1344003 RepID=A0A1N7DMP4_9NOCA|nr:ABC transporter permease subunit [Williamsia sterculiae]SIR76965.1 NitT/TauT family transport system permease protein [Williamsia sterculiae]